MHFSVLVSSPISGLRSVLCHPSAHGNAFDDATGLQLTIQLLQQLHFFLVFFFTFFTQFLACHSFDHTILELTSIFFLRHEDPTSDIFFSRMASLFSRLSHGCSRFGFVVTLVALAVLAFCSFTASAESKAASTAIPFPISSEELNDRLQECDVVHALGQQKLRLYAGEDGQGGVPSSTTAKIFSILFPGSPAVNALLATLYISGPPNFLLALCPPNIDPASLSVMVAFAVGGLLGDTLFHLLPEIFVGEDDERADRARLVLVEPNRNLLLGVAIMIGFLTFVAMDKGLRIATGGNGHEHNHGSHSHDEKSSAVTTSSDAASGSAKSRKKGGNKKKDSEETKAVAEANASVKLSGYLNLM